MCFCFLQSERVHCRWAMLAVAGILVQEIVRPDVFWYDAAVKVDIGGPEKILGLVGLFSACRATSKRRVQPVRIVLSTCCGAQVAFELFAMHWCAHSPQADLPAAHHLLCASMLATFCHSFAPRTHYCASRMYYPNPNPDGEGRAGWR